jgi:signal transduction histidine kinase
MPHQETAETLPRRPGAVAGRTKVTPNILVVDDRRENLLATERVLRPLDAVVHTAGSGNEALSMMLRHRFAVVLLDVQMPDMDGFETAQLMRDHESMRGTPIIFVTAISKEEKYASQAAEIGAVDYIFKPINTDILRSKVKVYLDLFVQCEEVSRLNHNLRQSNEELERFAYICSHDMQEPVRMMNSFAGLLEEHCGATLDADGSRYLSYIVGNAQRMHKMISDILTFARVGREELSFTRLDSGRILKEVLEEFDGAIRRSGAEVTSGELPLLWTSETVMRILFQNLLGNALKFQDGTKRPRIEIWAERADGAWRFSVRDNGIGIDRAFHPKVFTIFKRYHSSNEFPGTGIGLSTCRKLARLCGGDIDFESTRGAGSTFSFTTPAMEGDLA